MGLKKGFYQQPIADEDKWKVSFFSEHRGHERFTRSVMVLATSPAVFQHRMESTLREHF